MKIMLVIGGLLVSALAQAAVTETEAAKLGAELTPVGAEKAGNREGSIPQWKGGQLDAPAGWSPGKPRPDPYANEKPLFSIDAGNVDQYKNRLSAGQVELVKSTKSYRMDIYPSHRSCGYPDYYYQRTRINAASAELSQDGIHLAKALGAATPFPIPKNGNEAMWNHKLKWQGEGFVWPMVTVVPPKGSPGIGEPLISDEYMTSPMWSPKNMGVADAKGIEFYYLSPFRSPPSIAGDTTLLHYNLAKPNDMWIYFASQRRVRRAPTYQYDAPILNYENLMVMDQYLLFNGQLDRYDFRLSGKKEMYVPYNWYKVNSTRNRIEDVAGHDFLNRDMARYELHRVWVVEATVKPGMRHVFPKRVLYIDEDSWHIILADLYDAQGKVQRVMEAGVYMAWEVPACIDEAYASYDLAAGRYVMDRFPAEQQEPDFLAARQGRLKESLFDPDGLRRFSNR